MTNRNIISFDYAIKQLFRKKSNFVVLEGLLSELLHKDVKIEAVLESESNKRHWEAKFNRVDVLVSTEDQEKIISKSKPHESRII